jgi:hypothetical protein
MIFASADLDANPIELVDAQGRTVRQLGEKPTDYMEKTVALADAGGGRFWMAKASAYTLQLRDTTNALHATLVRDVPWFRSWTWKEYRHPYSEPPQPEVASLSTDSAGRIWVLLRVPSTEWKAPLASTTAKTSEGIRPAGSETGDYSNYYDSIIEIIDPRKGEVLLSKRFRQLFWGFASPGYVYTYRETEDGNAFLDAWRLDFHAGKGK